MKRFKKGDRIKLLPNTIRSRSRPAGSLGTIMVPLLNELSGMVIVRWDVPHPSGSDDSDVTANSLEKIV